MKDYLQLDGMVYKLVPVKNCNPKDGSPLDMGQIDSEKMYTNVMKWDWGNSDTKYTMIQKQKREYHLQNKSCSINGSIDCGEKSDRQKRLLIWR
jgi:hypothetical protein